MIRNTGRVVLLIAALVTGTHLCAQDYLLSWVPSNGSSFGPVTMPNGHMDVWQDGDCTSKAQVQASVTEDWICGTDATATVQGTAGLNLVYDDQLCTQVPNGVWAIGSAQSPPGTPVDQEYGEQICSGSKTSSGGPHPWPCGHGSTPQPVVN